MGFFDRLFGQSKRRTTTPQVIGKSLFIFAGRTIADISEDLQKDKLKIGSVQPAIYLRGRAILNLFAVDFSVFLAYSDGPLKNAILDSFWLEHEGLQTEPEYAAFTKGCKERCLQYQAAVRQGGDLFLEVGRVFASACGCPGDLYLAMAAGGYFGIMRRAVNDILHKFNVVV